MAQAKRNTNWFVEPIGAHSNQIIAENLAKLNEADATSLEVIDNKGKPHSVYQIYDYSFITNLIKAKAKFNLSMNIYYRSGVNGAIRPWELVKKAKKLNLKFINKKAL